jgi:hypothetical protein
VPWSEGGFEAKGWSWLSRTFERDKHENLPPIAFGPIHTGRRLACYLGSWNGAIDLRAEKEKGFANPKLCSGSSKSSQQ